MMALRRPDGLETNLGESYCDFYGGICLDTDGCRKTSCIKAIGDFDLSA